MCDELKPVVMDFLNPVLHLVVEPFNIIVGPRSHVSPMNMALEIRLDPVLDCKAFLCDIPLQLVRNEKNKNIL